MVKTMDEQATEPTEVSFLAEALEKQAAYREQRRAWALAHDQPYRDDGGADGYRSGNAKARTF